MHHVGCIGIKRLHTLKMSVQGCLHMRLNSSILSAVVDIVTNLRNVVLFWWTFLGSFELQCIRMNDVIGDVSGYSSVQVSGVGAFHSRSAFTKVF